MRKRLWDLAKSRIEIATILPGHRHKVTGVVVARRRRRGRQKKIAARPSVGRLVKRPHVNMGHGNGWDR